MDAETACTSCFEFFQEGQEPKRFGIKYDEHAACFFFQLGRIRIMLTLFSGLSILQRKDIGILP